jgi:hypothetical protein
MPFACMNVKKLLPYRVVAELTAWMPTSFQGSCTRRTHGLATGAEPANPHTAPPSADQVTMEDRSS